MNYAETLDYLFTRLPMYSRIGAAAYKTDLHNTLALLKAINDPHRTFKTIHVAGTNGKGSVSHMLAAILQEAGYKTGLYTSPHLVDFRERIRINGEMIPKQTVVAFTERIKNSIDAIEPSFFELTVAMAFDHFAQESVDIAVIETGLGGRLDSTNVIQPELSVITNIGWDHMNLLGDTLEKIAFEKAGIIKSHTPVVIGEWIPETRAVFEKRAQELEAPITWAGSNFLVESFDWTPLYQTIVLLEKKSGQSTAYALDLLGHYQQKNVLTVLESIRLLQQQGWKISEEATHGALKKVKSLTGLAGRWELLRTNPYLILDVAHNIHGLEALLQQLKTLPHRKLHLVLGMVNDKDIRSFLEKLPPAAGYYFTQAAIPRALPGNQQREVAGTIGLTGSCYLDVNAAIQAALEQAHADDLIVVTGSIFLIGEVTREALR
jgi:dihydrofolate synthase/folylpolyglutamate synthase